MYRKLVFTLLRRPSSSTLLRAISVTTLLAAACEPVTFDPRGTEVALYGDWTINGLYPESTTACADANVATVELVFFTNDETASYTDETFRFPCEQGVYDSVGPVLRRGVFKYEWRFYEPGATTPIVTDAQRYVMDTRGLSSFDLTNVNLTRAGATVRVVARGDAETFDVP